GARWDATAYETKGQLVFTEVLPLGPAALAGIKTGEVLTAVDGTPITGRINLYQLLEHKVGKRVELTVNGRMVVVRPVTNTVEKNLLYRAWVEDRRTYVEKGSGGKL